MIVRNGPDARQRLDMDDNLVRLGPAGVVRARHKSQKMFLLPTPASVNERTQRHGRSTQAGM
jgi:hypothetical protein